MTYLVLCWFYLNLILQNEMELVQPTDNGALNLVNNMADPEGTSSDQTCQNTCSELVPYEPPRILPQFHEPQRRFEFGGKEWVVLQQWGELGVPAVVWEAALVLSKYLETRSGRDVIGKRVLELGAGTGLVGMVASVLGAQTVVLTDRNTASAEANVEANRENLRERSITVSQLEWGQNVSSFNPPFDVVLAADVVYIEESFPLLLQSLCDLSSHETAIFLSCKHRYEREDRFIKMAKGVFRTEILWSDQALNQIRIYRLQKKSQQTNCSTIS